MPMETVLKKSLPDLLRSCKDFIEVSIDVKLFGVSVFQFRWPPKKEVEVESNLKNE